ncbi:tRNA pseudouridine(38-40) synthase [Malassezia psittaci]|uniref:tRNA pseudouridine(38-40) synthase n=1 Tax=Malassezia psittaci TaxID=1821823 RepID=A0AAF0F3M6_9BASI|nr:tRNA pseudouridine(38-40) synthase [Malassezia psittaci]
MSKRSASPEGQVGGESTKAARTQQTAASDEVQKDSEGGSVQFQEKDTRNAADASITESSSVVNSSSADDAVDSNKEGQGRLATIEGDIFDAFCRAGAVSEENAVNPNKIQLQRAARTDRGVHAAGNLLTAKLILQPPALSDGQTLTEYVNTLLPSQVRIWGMRRVQNAFNARTSCDSRLYEYLLPTYVFLPPKPYSSMWKMLRRLNVGEEDPSEPLPPWEDPAVKDNPMLNHSFWQAQGYENDFAADMHAKRRWRISAKELDRVRAVFDMYTGPHNFHNFTVGRDYRDRSSHRVMKKLSISDPKLINDTEWVSVKFHGQSFMLHQIRKMVGLLVLIGRTNAPLSLISQAFGPARIHVPKAPGLGLLLVEPHFGGYNIKVQNNNERIDRMTAQRTASGKALPPNTEDGKREPVDYEEFQERMDVFKQSFIYDEIHRTEDSTAEFAKWLNYLDVFVGPDLYVY